MKKKLIAISSLVLIGLIFFTGCNPMRKERAVADTWETTLAEWKTLSPKELEKHIELEVSDTYHINAELMVSEKLDDYEIPNVYLRRHVYEDTEAVLKEWLDYCGVSSYSDITKGKRDDILENGERIAYAMTDFGEDNQSWAQVRSVHAGMYTPFSDHYGSLNLLNMFHYQNSGWMDYEKMKSPSEKEIITQEQVSDIKKNIESIFDTEFLDENILYIYTLERLQEVVEYERAYQGKVGFVSEESIWNVAEDDEGTVLCFLQGYEGIPLFYGDASQNTTGAVWGVENYCLIISSKEGIEGLEFKNPYDITGEAESVEILTFGEFMEKHIEMCSAVDTTVVNVGLYYLPVYMGENLDFVTKPVWCVQTEETEAHGYPLRQTFIYDAVTGEEIPWEG